MDCVDFLDAVKWTATEKKVARKAFDQALERHLAAITAEARRDDGERQRAFPALGIGSVPH